MSFSETLKNVTQKAASISGQFAGQALAHSQPVLDSASTLARHVAEEFKTHFSEAKEQSFNSTQQTLQERADQKARAEAEAAAAGAAAAAAAPANSETTSTVDPSVEASVPAESSCSGACRCNKL